MTRTAFAVWEDRIAPVLDTARSLRIVEAEGEQILSEMDTVLPNGLPAQTALGLTELRIEVLICGAVSKTLHGVISAYGIKIIPFVAGNVHEVIQAWVSGKLEVGQFTMPGCFGDAGRFRPRHSNLQEENTMNERVRGGMGRGGGGGRGGSGGGGRGQGRRGQGQGQGQDQGQGQGRMGGPSQGGPDGYCICPSCKYREPHERGLPCSQKQCPKCGSTMVRE